MKKYIKNGSYLTGALCLSSFMLTAPAAQAAKGGVAGAVEALSEKLTTLEEKQAADMSAVSDAAAEALAKAIKAQSDAATAQNTAATAQGTANTALANAATAQTKADKAASDAAADKAAADDASAKIAQHLQTLHIAAVTCPDGQLLAGIDSGGSGICVQSPLSSLTASCNEGEYMSGIENGTIICKPFPDTATGISTVTSKVTGRVWMALDLGQTKKPQDYGDKNAPGSLYQWGRGTDGHESRTSELSDEVISATGKSSKFITEHTWFSEDMYPGGDWNALNNPCPDGFVVPTVEEFLDEYPDGAPVDYADNVLGIGGSFGTRSAPTGEVWGSETNPGTIYWTADLEGYNAHNIQLFPGEALHDGAGDPGYGLSVRCIKPLK